MSENLESVVRALRNAGAAVHRGPARFFDAYRDTFSDHSRVTALEAYSTWRHILCGPLADRMDPRVRDRMQTGLGLMPRLSRIWKGRKHAVEAFRHELGDRILLTPTVNHVAPPIAPLEADAEAHREINLQTLRLTMPGNWLRCCGLSLPSGTDDNGLPTGVLLTLPWGEDDRLLAIGLAVERTIRAGARSDLRGLAP